MSEPRCALKFWTAGCLSDVLICNDSRSVISDCGNSKFCSLCISSTDMKEAVRRSQSVEKLSSQSGVGMPKSACPWLRCNSSSGPSFECCLSDGSTLLETGWLDFLPSNYTLATAVSTLSSECNGSSGKLSLLSSFSSSGPARALFSSMSDIKFAEL